MSFATPSASTTLAQAMLERLRVAGVTHVFGLPGVHNLAFWEASGEIPTIVGVRHEQTAGYAADGFARVSGGLGVAITTTGPGAANVVAAFGESAVSHSKVIVLASEVSTALRKPGVSRGILHEMADQSGLFTQLASKDEDGTPLAFSTTTASAALDALERVLHFAERRGEVAAYIGIPSDVLGGAVAGELPLPLVEIDNLKADFTTAASMINAAKRPLLWLGGGAASMDQSALAEFAEKLAAPVVTSFAGRGLLGSHELLAGGPIHEPEIHQIAVDADLLLVLGSDFDGMNTRNWQMPVPSQVIAINHSLEPVSTNLPGAHVVRASLREIATLTALIDAKSKWVAQPALAGRAMRDRLSQDERATIGMGIVNEIEKSWPASANVVCDMTTSGYWFAGYGTQSRPRRLAYPVGWGTLGFGFPAAIGAAFDAPTLSLCGDGGIMFALGELATLVQEHIPMTLFIVDDGGYGMLRFDQQVFGHAERGVDLVTPDWAILATSFGISFTEILSVDQLGEALALGHDRNVAGHPHMIVLNATIHPPRTTSPRWRESMAIDTVR
jgi:thiamine pyrophosphate-dependent acetolactate synthase large subunit-like protein